MTTAPRATYTQFLERRRGEIARLQERHRGLGYAKITTAVLGILLVWLSLARGAFSIVWVLIPIGAFTVLVVVHEGVLRAIERVRRAERYFETALKRLD